MQKIIKRIFHAGTLIIMSVLIFSMLSMNSEAAEYTEEDNSLKKVRVGYLIYEGYQEGEGDQPKSGYGYEYLQQIAYYAGWEYYYLFVREDRTDINAADLSSLQNARIRIKKAHNILLT